MIIKAAKVVGWKNLIIWSILTGLVFVILDALIGMLQGVLFAGYASLPVWKIPPETTMGIVFDLFNGLLLVSVYALIKQGVPGQGVMKGLNYGVIVGIFKSLMGAFTTFVIMAVPLDVILISTVLGFVKIIIICVCLAWMGEKFKV